MFTVLWLTSAFSLCSWRETYVDLFLHLHNTKIIWWKAYINIVTRCPNERTVSGPCPGQGQEESSMLGFLGGQYSRERAQGVLVQMLYIEVKNKLLRSQLPGPGGRALSRCRGVSDWVLWFGGRTSARLSHEPGRRCLPCRGTLLASPSGPRTLPCWDVTSSRIYDRLSGGVLGHGPFFPHTPSWCRASPSHNQILVCSDKHCRSHPDESLRPHPTTKVCEHPVGSSWTWHTLRHLLSGLRPSNLEKEEQS